VLRAEWRGAGITGQAGERGGGRTGSTGRAGPVLLSRRAARECGGAGSTGQDGLVVPSRCERGGQGGQRAQRERPVLPPVDGRYHRVTRGGTTDHSIAVCTGHATLPTRCYWGLAPFVGTQPGCGTGGTGRTAAPSFPFPFLFLFFPFQPKAKLEI
jgi:hypothetical protein